MAPWAVVVAATETLICTSAGLWAARRAVEVAAEANQVEREGRIVELGADGYLELLGLVYREGLYLEGLALLAERHGNQYESRPNSGARAGFS